MLFDFLKKRHEYIEVEPKGNGKKSKILVWLIVAAIFLLAFGGIGEKDEPAEDKALTDSMSEIAAEQYIAENEKRLEGILSRIQGAGSVKTMITIDNAGEKVLAVDKKSENSQENDKEKSTKAAKQEQTALVYGSGSGEQPFVLKNKLPSTSGVLVVAAGAGDERVRLEIYEAVKALYGISGHRIKVTKGIIK